MIQEVNKNPQLHSFDPSDLRCLVWSQTSRGYKWIRICKMRFPRFFPGDSLLEFHVKFKAAKFTRYPSLNYLN